jgi:2-oxoisovalerate dehydrogenase E2 component (dihydrolipoyl transacylase)
MPTTIKMPQLGESVTEGTIERWLVKEGDTVEQYDPLFEVVTDKVNAEVPAEIAGTITKIMVPDGETVAVGTALAEIDADGQGAADGAPAATGGAPAATDAPSAPEAAPPADAPPPAEAPSDQPAAAPAAASEHVAPAPSEAAPADGTEHQEPAAPTPAGEAAPASAPPPRPAAEPAAAEKAAPPTDGSMRMTPAVRRLVREHNVDVARITGTGSGGRVTREDVLQAVAHGGQPAAATSHAPTSPEAAAPSAPEATPAASAEAPAPAPAPPAAAGAPVPSGAGGDTEITLSQMRKGIAAKMTQVKQTVPHAYTVIEVDMGNVVRWREANQSAYKAREGIGISYVAAVIKVVTETLRQHPTINAQFAGDKIILKRQMNIGIAVAIDNGLIVPVIHDADQLSLSGVNRKLQDLAARARSNKLRLDEIQGGTFTVNNTGWFGSVSSMPIINAPEVAILSMEAIVKRPRVIEVDGSDVIAIRPMMNITCSFDHRVLDGAQVGFFLADVRKRLEAWSIDTPLG